MTKQFGIRQIPHMLLYDAEGKMVRGGYPAAYEAFLDME